MTKKINILKERDQACSSYLSKDWLIKEDNVGSRQCILRKEWTIANYFWAIVGICIWIVPGVVYITHRNTRKKLVNY